MSGVTKLVNQLSRALTTQARQPRRSRRARRSPRRQPRSFGAAMPMAYATHVRSYFRMRPAPGSRLRIAGCDLVTPIEYTRVWDTSLSSRPVQVFSVITANPVYWAGTRISAIAAAYFNYRPIKMCFHYVPQVPVTVSGTVVAGTLWCGQSPSNDLQQTLVTSNGGIMNQCYVPADSRLALGNNLPQRMFFTQGEFSTDTNPFVWVALNVGGVIESERTTVAVANPGYTPITPGYYFVEYEFELANPLGSAATFFRSPVQAATIPTPSPVSSAVVVNSDTIPLGTVLLRDQGTWFLSGDPVSLTTSDLLIAYSQQLSPATTKPATIAYDQYPFTPITTDPTTEGRTGFVAYLKNCINNGFRVFLGNAANTAAELTFPAIGKTLIWAFNQSANVTPVQAGFNVFDFYKLELQERNAILQKLGVTSVEQLGTDVQVKAITYRPSGSETPQPTASVALEQQPEDNLQGIRLDDGSVVVSHPLLPLSTTSVTIYSIGPSMTDNSKTGSYTVFVPSPSDYNSAFCGVSDTPNTLLITNNPNSVIDASGANYQALLEYYDELVASPEGKTYLWSNYSSGYNLWTLSETSLGQLVTHLRG